MLTLEPCLVGMKACGGAHHWARLPQSHGHEVRLMSCKNDFLDAEAICEAVTRPTMCFVAVKTADA